MGVHTRLQKGNKMNKYIKLVLSLPKTMFWNIRLFGAKKGVRMPLLIAYNVKLKVNRGGLLLPSDIGMWKIKIGFNDGTYGIEKAARGGIVSVSTEGHIAFNGSADFKAGITMIVSGKGCISFGPGFTCNRNCCFTSDNSIEIGDDALLGWNVKIRTSDGHPIYPLDQENMCLNEGKPVRIGDHVWLAAHVDILKGSMIPDGCVVGYRSCVTKAFFEPNCIIAGYPAKIIKKGIRWKRD